MALYARWCPSRRLLTCIQLIRTSHFSGCCLSSKMKAAVVHRFGDVENIRIEQGWQIPSFTDQQVLVRVKAAAVNPVDTYIRSGKYANLPQLPYIPGREGAGIVEKVGAAVKNVSPGDRIWFSTPASGSCAEFSVVDSDVVFPLPENASFVAGSTLGIAYLTAYRALFGKAKAQAGESVFIHGASGGVGTAAIQLAKVHGMKVIGTAGTEEGMELARQQGADFVINHNDVDYVDRLLDKYKEGFNVILEMLANVNLNNDLVLVSKYGRICVIGNRGNIQIDPRRLMMKESSIIGVMLGHTEKHEMQYMGKALSQMMAQGQLKPAIDQEMALEDVGEAHTQVMEKSASKGKLVINLEL